MWHYIYLHSVIFLVISGLAAISAETSAAETVKSVQQGAAAEDAAQAFEGYRKAAEQGEAWAQFNLGRSYYNGDGVAKDAVKAVEWFRKAAGQGEAKAQCALGVCYANGNGVAKDPVKAVEWYWKAAEQGLARAQYNLGGCYANGNGVAKDASEAVEWYRKAADQGEAWAQFKLGVCYYYGDGVAKDLVKAVEWYRKAAERGIAEAQYNLGFCCGNGIGMAKDASKAVEWLRKAADQGDILAQYSLGGCYGNGTGVAKNSVKAVEWYRKAADQGYAPAQYNLGVHYDNGKGVAKNSVKAVEWYRKAADQGLPKGQVGLGFCYLLGRGVTKNEKIGYAWMLVARAGGCDEIDDTIRDLERGLSRAEMAAGQELAAQLSVKKERADVVPRREPAQTADASTGSGFFVTEDGYLVTNAHVIEGAKTVRVKTQHGLLDAAIVLVDQANDLCVLRVEGGSFRPLPVVSSKTARLGSTVVTVGFPNIGMQGLAPKVSKGEIASLSGILDSPSKFQISVPVQPGNSGGALVDLSGNVVGVVSSKLRASTALEKTGSLPENVNYAVKSSLVLNLLESIPGIESRLPKPQKGERKLEDIVEEIASAAVLVFVQTK
jgi:TPR repeat protein/S1-C subfamily serine protease